MPPLGQRLLLFPALRGAHQPHIPRCYTRLAGWQRDTSDPITDSMTSLRPFLPVDTGRLAERPGRGRHHLTLRDITTHRLELYYCLGIYSSSSGRYRQSVGDHEMLDAARQSSCHWRPVRSPTRPGETGRLHIDLSATYLGPR